MVKKILKIEGMTCAACAKAVERAVRKLDGIYKADVNLATEKIFLEYELSKVKISDIKNSVEKAGYRAVEEDIALTEDKNPKKEDKLYRKKLIVSLVFALPLLYISMGHMVNMPLPSFLNPEMNPATFALTQLILTCPVIAAGYRFYTVGFKTLLKRSPNMDSLIAIGTSAAFLYGIFAVIKILRGGFEFVHSLYFESAAVIITLIMLGKYLESVSKGKTSQAIKTLLRLAPKTATIIKDDREEIIPLEEVAEGDIIIVKPGERMPVDGVVTEGTTSVDESMLTGESIPVEKRAGCEIIGAGINKNGTIKYRATKVGKDTVLSQIIKLVEEAQGSKAPIARLADVISGYFVPTVIFLAVTSALAWYFIGKESAEFSLKIFISVLVIACPCALGLATPTAIIVGTGKGALYGVLFKSAQALETAHRIKKIVFDKTGTVTAGMPKVTDIIAKGISEDELLKIAACAEKGSEHSIAEAVIRASQEKGQQLSGFDYFKAIPGFGIEAKTDNNRVLIGNRKLMEQNRLFSEHFQADFDRLSGEGKTLMCIAVNNEMIGIIAIADTVKQNSRETIEILKNMGIECFIITGDNKSTAKAVAGQVGIEKVLAEVLPHEKANQVKRLQAHGVKVAMVGDGINDAPALAQADVGIAIGSGTDVAIESADIVLIKSDLSDVVTAIQLSKSTMRNIRENLFWAFGYNAIGIPIAMGVLYAFGGPLLNPMIAAAAMSLSSVSVVLNALRLKRLKLANSGKRRKSYEKENYN